MHISAVLLLLLVAFTVNEAASESNCVTDIPITEDETSLLNVTFVYNGEIGDFGYNYAFHLARLALQVHYQYRVWCFYVITNPLNAEQTNASISAAAQTSNVVITTSSDLRQATINVAKLYPDVYFLMAGGTADLPNLGIYQTVYNDARFLTGILAAMKSVTNTICFLSSYRLNFLLGGFNSWVLGARSKKKDIKVLIAFTDSWSKPEAENYAVEQMMDKGCDVVNGQVNNIKWQQVVADRGKLSIGFNSDIRLLIGESVLTSIINDFVGIFIQYFDEIICNETFVSGVRFYNLQNDRVTITDFGQNVTRLEARDILYNKTTLKQDNFFCGPIVASKLCTMNECSPAAESDKLMVPSGTCLPNWNITNFTPFLLEGVEDLGTIIAPDRSEENETLIIRERLDTPSIVGIVVGGMALMLFGGFAMIKVRQHRTAAVMVLKQVEEGQKKNYKIMFNELKFHEKIGAGNFGEVFAGEYRGADVAIKKLKFQDLQKRQISEFTQEVSVMVGLRHPNIVLLMGACNEPPNLCIVTEYMPQGSLYAVLHNDKLQFSEPIMKTMIIDVLKGLQFIHSAGLLHRDLKSPNLLVDKRGTIKLADFGLTILQSASINCMVHVSIPWTAPEILGGQPYTAKADVYSLGIIFWEILTRRFPFNDMLPAAIPRAVIQGKRPEIPSNVELLQALIPIIQKCWAHNMIDRPDVTEVRKAVEEIEVIDYTKEGSIHHPGGTSISSANTKSSASSSSGSSSTMSIVLPKMNAPTGMVTCLFVDIPESTALWEWDPHVMYSSLCTFHLSIELLLFKHRGYLVRSDGDAYMLTFADPSDAVSFSIDLHIELLKQDWSPKLLTHPAALELNFGNGLVWRGLRARVAAHAGPVQTRPGSQVEEVIYSGVVIDLVVKLGRLGQPGQTLITDTVRKLISSAGSRLISSSTIVELPAKPYKLHQVTHNTLLSREFAQSISSFDETAPIIDSNTLLSKSEKWIIPFKDIRLGAKLGSGYFGDTYMGTYDGKDIAVKIFPVRHLKTLLKLELREEIINLSRLSHPNLVRMYGLCMEEQIALIQDFVPRGSLHNILANNSVELSWERRLSFVLGIASGMAYLHSKNILHGDVKPTNFLVTHDWQIKVADLGFARIKTQHQTMTQSGVVSWTAPEVFDGEGYTKSSEVYSFAIILWEIITRQNAWEGIHALRLADVVAQGQRPSVSGIVSNSPIVAELVKLMIQCWKPRREERPTFSAIIELLRPLT